MGTRKNIMQEHAILVRFSTLKIGFFQKYALLYWQDKLPLWDPYLKPSLYIKPTLSTYFTDFGDSNVSPWKILVVLGVVTALGIDSF
jgi:hypothetical protein